MLDILTNIHDCKKYLKKSLKYVCIIYANANTFVPFNCRNSATKKGAKKQFRKMDKSEQLRREVADWFGSETAKRNGESKVNAFCEKVGINRRTYHRKITAPTEELDYEFLTQAADYIVEWKEHKRRQRTEKREQFEERATFALAI